MLSRQGFPIVSAEIPHMFDIPANTIGKPCASCLLEKQGEETRAEQDPQEPGQGKTGETGTPLLQRPAACQRSRARDHCPAWNDRRAPWYP